MSTKIGFWEKIYGSEPITFPYKKKHHEVDLVRDKDIVDEVTEIENESKVYELFSKMRREGGKIIILVKRIELSTNEIGRLVDLSRPTLLSVLKKLVQEKYLIRRRSDTDLRVWKYSFNLRRPRDDASTIMWFLICEEFFDNDTHAFMLSLFKYLKDMRHFRGMKE